MVHVKIDQKEIEVPEGTTILEAARMAGIDINDYLAAKNADSIKQYNDYNKRKTK